MSFHKLMKTLLNFGYFPKGGLYKYTSKAFKPLRKVWFFELGIKKYKYIFLEYSDTINPILYIFKDSTKWHDKYDIPIFDREPILIICLFHSIVFGFYLVPTFIKGDKEILSCHYWEQMLYCTQYCNGDVNKARETYQLEIVNQNGVKKSLWSDEFLK